METQIILEECARIEDLIRATTIESDYVEPIKAYHPSYRYNKDGACDDIVTTVRSWKR